MTKTIKHFRLKIKTKTKSKMPAKMNTGTTWTDPQKWTKHTNFKNKEWLWNPFNDTVFRDINGQLKSSLNMEILTVMIDWLTGWLMDLFI